MNHLHYIAAFPLIFSLVACFGTDGKTGVAGADSSIDGLKNNPSAKVIHEDGWTIVSRVENGDQVYWFLAPEVDDVSPAMFKKVIYTGDKSELETKTVSQCEAPKQTCDDLMKQFKSLSEKYK